jgi:hypothetical protein
MSQRHAIGALAILSWIAVSAVPDTAAAESLFARVATVFADNNGTNHQVIVTVTGGVTCGNNPGTAQLRWRDTETPQNFKEGVVLLNAALLSRATVLFDLTDTGSQCRINGIFIVAP